MSFSPRETCFHTTLRGTKCADIDARRVCFSGQHDDRVARTRWKRAREVRRTVFKLLTVCAQGY